MKILRVLATLVMVMIVAAPLNARQRTRNRVLALPTLSSVGSHVVLAALRSGGHLLACRHAITDRSGNRSGRSRLSDRSTQRNLSSAGEEQARSLGRALKRLNIPIGDVHASAYARTMESAQLAFDHATPDGMLYGSHSRRELRERFNRNPGDGNSVLMTHQGILRSALGYRQPGEGDCVVLRPSSGGPEVIANVTVQEWERLASGTAGGS